MSFDTNILVKPKTGYMDSNLQMLSYWLINTNLAERENKILIMGALGSIIDLFAVEAASGMAWFLYFFF